MTRLLILVEGQTEETFVRELLVPHYARNNLYITSTIARTSPGYKGGVVSYAKIKPQLIRLCKEDSKRYVTTFFDLYALPDDFPGKRVKSYQAQNSGIQKADFLEFQLKQDIDHPNFIPYLMVHEFEAFLFVQPEKLHDWFDDSAVINDLCKVAKEYGSPEDINDSPQTAPSKRILELISTYQKNLHGPLITCDIGLDTLRQTCSHFNAWLKRLDALAESL